MSKHTPGPWQTESLEHDGNCNVTWRPICTESHTLIAYCTLGPEEHEEGNARLIAAAPELLEALKAIRDHTFVDAEGPELRAQNECNHRRACAAIAKAEGSATADDATPADCCPYGCMDLPCEHFKRARP